MIMDVQKSRIQRSRNLRFLVQPVVSSCCNLRLQCATWWRHFRVVNDSLSLIVNDMFLQPRLFSVKIIDRPAFASWSALASGPDRIEYRLAVLGFDCPSRIAPSYLSAHLHCVAELESYRRLRSVMPRIIMATATQHSAISDRTCCVSARVQHSLPARSLLQHP